MDEINEFTLLRNMKKKECIDLIYKNIDNETMKNWLFEVNNNEEKIKKVIDMRFDKLQIKDFIMSKKYKIIVKKNDENIDYELKKTLKNNSSKSFYKKNYDENLSNFNLLLVNSDDKNIDDVL